MLLTETMSLCVNWLYSINSCNLALMASSYSSYSTPLPKSFHLVCPLKYCAPSELINLCRLTETKITQSHKRQNVCCFYIRTEKSPFLMSSWSVRVVNFLSFDTVLSSVRMSASYCLSWLIISWSFHSYLIVVTFVVLRRVYLLFDLIWSEFVEKSVRLLHVFHDHASNAGHWPLC